MTDLELAIKRIDSKNSLYTNLYSYLDGNPRLKFSTERLERAFGKTFVYFGQSWGNVIINAVLDRLVLKGFNSTNETANNKLDELFNKLNLNLDAQDIHEAVQVTGEAFLLVDIYNGEPEIYFNDPRLCEVIYDSARPKVKKYAAKKWVDGEINYVTLYYPDRIEKYESRSKAANTYKLIETLSNEFNEIPVFHFRNSRRIIKSEFDLSTISLLDAINKIFGDMMVAAEFEAFKMRVFISQTDPGEIKVSPDLKIWLPANENDKGQPTEIKEIGGGSLANFLEPLDKLAQTLAITTRTPKTYFINSGSNLSGEALIVEESALVKKVKNKEEAYTPTWLEFANYLLKISNISVDVSEISCVWENPETVLPLTQAQTIQAQVTAGIPLITSLRWQNRDEDEISQIMADKVEEDANKQNALATTLNNFNGQ